MVSGTYPWWAIIIICCTYQFTNNIAFYVHFSICFLLEDFFLSYFCHFWVIVLTCDISCIIQFLHAQLFGKVLMFSCVFNLLLGVPWFHSYMKEVGVRISGKVAFLVPMKRYASTACPVVEMCQYMKNNIQVSWYLSKSILVDIADFV